MQIKLVQTDIETAITQYIEKRFTMADGMELEIDLSATRGDDGVVANITILEPEAERPARPAAKPARVEKKAPANDPAPDPVEDTEEPEEEVSRDTAPSIFANMKKPDNSKASA